MSDGPKLPTNFGVMFVPQQEAWVVERMGRFKTVLGAGLRFLIPVLDRISYVHSLKEESHSVPNQMAITHDNVTIKVDGVLYLRVVDPYKASYGVDDAVYAMTQLAQTTMRSELGRISLDQTFKEREQLNVSIVKAIQDAASTWGIQVIRYEIRDIQAPQAVRDAMDKQAEAERRKRARVLESEGERQAVVNIASGQRDKLILESEAEQRSIINRAQGEAEGVRALAEATAAAINTVGSVIDTPQGKNAAAMRVAEQYVSAFSKVAKEGTTVLLPSQANDPGAATATALSIFQSLGRALPAQEARQSSGDSADVSQKQ